MQNEITELRNQVRTLKRIVYGFGCLLVAGIVVGATSLQTVPDVIQAKSFHVVNDEGNPLVGLGYMTANGVDNGAIVLGNSKQQPLVILGASDSGQGFIRTVDGKEGQTLVALGATIDGGMVVIKNGKGQELVTLGVTAGGNGSVKTQNDKGHPLVVLGSYTGLNGGYVETFTQTGVSTSEIP